MYSNINNNVFSISNLSLYKYLLTKILYKKIKQVVLGMFEMYINILII